MKISSISERIAVMALADYIIDKPTIETKRLILRPMSPSDVDALRQWMPDERIYTYWGKGPGKSEKDPQLMFEKKKKPVKSFHLGIAAKEDNRIIGDLWVYQIENNRMASVAIRLAVPCQKKGYGTESLTAITDFCFEHTELKRLWAEVDIRNTASVKMLEKCGFQREGLIRQGKMVSTWCDYYIYAKLKEDRQNLPAF